MILHEAMEQVLIEKNGRFPLIKLADIINEQQLYVRMDNKPVPISQIIARAKTHPDIFTILDDEIRLVKDDPEQLRFEKYRQEIVQQLKGKNPDLNKRITVLIDKLEDLLENDHTIDIVREEIPHYGSLERRDNFVIRAMRDIDEFSNSILQDIPYCVNAGFMDRFETLHGNVKIFKKKGEDQTVMFQHIKSAVNTKEYRTFKKQFGEAFEVFDRGMISKNYQRLLMDVLQAYKEKDFRKRNVTVQRDFFEAILLNMNRSIPFFPDDFIDRRHLPNQEWCVRYIEGRKLFVNDIEIPKHDKNISQNIKSSFRKLKESVNGYSHLLDETIVKIPFLANTFLLLEILEWLPQFVAEYYKRLFLNLYLKII